MAAKTLSYSQNSPALSIRGHEGVYLLAPNETDYTQLSKLNNFQ